MGEAPKPKSRLTARLAAADSKDNNRGRCLVSIRQLKRYGKAVLALAMVVGPVAVFATPASATHESTTIRVGISSLGRNGAFYDDSDLTRLVGTTFTFSFDAGNHNVLWTTANPGALANSPAAPAADNVGTSYTVRPTVAGTYIYYCSRHTSAAVALAATDFGAAETADQYGRLVITADTTPPTWPAGAVTATANSASQITVTWPAATDNSGSVFYDVFQSTNATQPAAPVGDNVSGLSYVATGLTSGTTYYFWVVAVDGTATGNPALPARTANATTVSVAVSATASAVVAFTVNPTLSITVTPPTPLNLGNLSPAAVGTGSATVTVQSNDIWSLSVKSTGRNGIDDAAGDDLVFTELNGVKTIPVGRATWSAGGGAIPLSDVSAVVRTAQPATLSTAVVFAFSVTPLFTDPVGTDYRTTVLYTATQP